MMRKGGYTVLVVLTCVALLPGCHSQGEGYIALRGRLYINHTVGVHFQLYVRSYLGSLMVVIDGYTNNIALISGDSVPLGTQLILVCQVVGLPYGTPLSYTWTCPNGTCEVEWYYGRKIYNEHILAVNTTSTNDGGTYTCQVIATGGREASGSFIFGVSGECGTADKND